MDILNEISSENPLPELDQSEPPPGSDRRTFLMRSALAAAMVSLTGRPMAAFAQAPATPPAAPPLSPASSLDVVRRSRGPIQTTVEEMYKVGPGPSSSHTIGPMRITYDFYQRCTRLPADQQARATAMKVICSAA
jgi:L-serine dehydratase